MNNFRTNVSRKVVDTLSVRCLLDIKPLKFMEVASVSNTYAVEIKNQPMQYEATVKLSHVEDGITIHVSVINGGSSHCWFESLEDAFHFYGIPWIPIAARGNFYPPSGGLGDLALLSDSKKGGDHDTN